MEKDPKSRVEAAYRNRAAVAQRLLGLMAAELAPEERAEELRPKLLHEAASKSQLVAYFGSALTPPPEQERGGLSEDEWRISAAREFIAQMDRDAAMEAKRQDASRAAVGRLLAEHGKGEIPLEAARAAGNPDLIRVLLEAGADDPTALSTAYRTIEGSRGSVSAADLLAGPDPNEKFVEGASSAQQSVERLMAIGAAIPVDHSSTPGLLSAFGSRPVVSGMPPAAKTDPDAPKGGKPKSPSL